MCFEYRSKIIHIRKRPHGPIKSVPLPPKPTQHPKVMYENIQVQCSGAFYASLHCEVIHNAGIQEGFFKGEIEKHTSFDINDSDLNSENATIKINISGYIPCTTVGNFYNGCGKISTSSIENLTDNMEEIVGWYKCRRNTNGSFLKEIKVHEQLCELFSSKGKYFLFALFTRNYEMPLSTMDISYKFQVMSSSSCEFTSVPLNIINLNNTSAAGQIKASSSILYNSEALEKILFKIQNLEPGVKEVESIHMELIRQVQSLLPKFASVQEKYRHSLKRVNHLREYCHNYDLKLDEVRDKSNWNEEGVHNGGDSCEHSEKDELMVENKSEIKLLLKTKEAKDSCPENSKLFNNNENGKENLGLNVTKSKKKSLISHLSQKENIESHSDSSDPLTISQNLSKETSEDSSPKKINPCSGQNKCKGNKNEANVSIAKKATTNSALSEETKTAEKNVMFSSDSPEF